MKNYELIHGECLEEMKKIKDHSINLILCDLPYGTTNCKWDKKINIDLLWKEYKRILKENGIILLFGSEPFSSELRISNLDWYKYDIIWNKVGSGNALNAHNSPLKIHENISVFYNKNNTYDKESEINKIINYLRKEKQKSGLTNKQVDEIIGVKAMSKHYFSRYQFQLIKREYYKKLQDITGNFNKNYDELLKEYENITKQTYNMQGLKIHNKKEKSGLPRIISDNRNTKEYIREYTNFPKSIITFSKEFSGFHPTQKPVRLLEYLIKTYSNEGEIVLDNTMGSGSTGVAAINTNRRFIGIELDDKYFEIATKRIQEAETKKNIISKSYI